MFVGLCRQLTGLFGGVDNAQSIAQPLNGGSGNKDRAFEGVGNFSI